MQFLAISKIIIDDEQKWRIGVASQVGGLLRARKIPTVQNTGFGWHDIGLLCLSTNDHESIINENDSMALTR